MALFICQDTQTSHVVMRRHSNGKERAKTAGSTSFVNNIVDLAMSHMRGHSPSVAFEAVTHKQGYIIYIYTYIYICESRQ